MVSTTAFVPGAAVFSRATISRGVVSTRKAPVQMSMRRNAARLAALPATLATIVPALATEGTGEGLGIDTALLFIPLILIPGAFLALFLQFDGSQNKEDFLGEYDERRN